MPTPQSSDYRAPNQQDQSRKRERDNNRQEAFKLFHAGFVTLCQRLKTLVILRCTRRDATQGEFVEKLCPHEATMHVEFESQQHGGTRLAHGRLDGCGIRRNPTKKEKVENTTERR